MKPNAILAALATLSFGGAFAAPTSSQDNVKKWTFRDLHNYAIANGGHDDPLAAHIEARMASEDHPQTWETEYDHSITTDDGGVLTTPGSRLSKRQFNSSLTAYLYTSNCASNDVQFTWTDSDIVCHTFSMGGSSFRMYSAIAQSDTFPNFVTWPTDQNCHTGLFDNFHAAPNNECHYEPQGWMGWNWPNI